MSVLPVHELRGIVIQILLFAFPTAITFLLSLPFTVGKYFDQWFGETNPPLAILYAPFKGFGRAQYYSLCIVFKKRSSTKRLYPYYQGFDFRGHARKIDVIISHLNYYSAAITLALGLIWYVLSLF